MIDMKPGDKVERIAGQGEIGGIYTIESNSACGRALWLVEGVGMSSVPNFRKVDMNAKKTPHPHAEIIKAWADGAEIQYRDIDGGWYDLGCTPSWIRGWEYRIKPEPKPDVVQYTFARLQTTCWAHFGARVPSDNVKFTFDGETGKLKSVEMV